MVTQAAPLMQPKSCLCYEKEVKSTPKTPQKAKTSRPRRPPPAHQGTLEEAIARLGLRGVTVKPMFGGRCFYADGKPFSLLLGNALALKLSAQQLKTACAQGAGQLFHPGGGDFIMREYLELSDQVLMDEGQVDAYVLASYRFIVGQEILQDELSWNDLLEGREHLYERRKKGRGTGEAEQ
jgi:TfoX/Sxy family transcriptional regulator of competence genes